MKKLLMALLMAVMILPQGFTVSAAQDSDIVLYGNDGNTVTLYAEGRDDQDPSKLIKPEDLEFIIENKGSHTYTDLSVEMADDEAKKDIDVSIVEGNGSSFSYYPFWPNNDYTLPSTWLNVMHIRANFKTTAIDSKYKSTSVLIKNGSQVIQTIPFEYYTTPKRSTRVAELTDTTSHASASTGFTFNGSYVYALNSTGRYSSQKILMPSDRTITLKNNTGTPFSGYSVSLSGDVQTVGGKEVASTKTSDAQVQKDLKVSASGSVAVGSTLTLKVNFKRNNVEPCLRWAKINVKDSSGTIIKTLRIAYSTTGYYDEHPNSISQWGGSNFSFSEAGNFYTAKKVGTIDVYQSKPTMNLSFTAKGSKGVKAIYLEPTGDFTFSNGKYKISGSSVNTKVGGKTSLKVKCKSGYTSSWKSLMKKSKYTSAVTLNPLIWVEFSDGCIIGGNNDPIFLVHGLTVKPIGKTTVKTKKRTRTTIKISWAKRTKVTGYKIYRSTKKTKGYKMIAKVSYKKLSYTNKKLKSGKTYYYKVKAYRTVYKKNYNSSYSSAHKTTTRPKATTVRLKKLGKKIKIKYAKVTRASGYQIKMKQGKKGKYRTIKTYSSGKKISFKTSKQKKKKTYYVKVRAYKKWGKTKIYSSYSKVKKIKI